MGLKSKVCYALTIIGGVLTFAGAASAIATGISGTSLREDALELLKTDQAYRLTAEFNLEEDNFRLVTEKYESGEINQMEYLVSKMEFDNAKKEYEENINNLESREYLQTLMDSESVPKSEECVNEYDKSTKLLQAIGGSIGGSLVGLATFSLSALDLCIFKEK